MSALQAASARLYRAAAEAGVVEELKRQRVWRPASTLELEEFADVVGSVLQRVVARAE